MLVGVCEDDAGIRRLLTGALRFAGHESVMAHSGSAALRLEGTNEREIAFTANDVNLVVRTEAIVYAHVRPDSENTPRAIAA